MRNYKHYFYNNIYLGTGEEAQQPEQLEEQDHANEMLKVHEQLLLAFKEIEKEMESLGNTFAITFQSYTLEARGQLAKIQVHCNAEMTIIMHMNQTMNLDRVYSKLM